MRSRPSLSKDMPGFQFDTSWVFLSMFLFWAGAFEIAPHRFQDQGPLFDGLVGMIVVLLYFLCVLVHEGGHKIAAWATGSFYEGNLLTIWGGVPREALSFGAPDARDRIVRMGGPMLNLIAAFLLFHFASQLSASHGPFPKNIAFFLHFGAQANLLLAVINMIPVLPFDLGALLLGDGTPATAVRERWTVQGGLGISWILTLVSLAVAAKGGLISGFGGIFLGIHMARTVVVWKARIGLSRYLALTPIDPFIEPVQTILKPDVTVAEAYSNGFFPFGRAYLPVCDAQGAFMGFLSWEEMRKTKPEWRPTLTVGSLALEQKRMIQLEFDAFAWSRLFDAIERRERIVFVLKDGTLVGSISPRKVVERFRMQIALGSPEEVRGVTMREGPEDRPTTPDEPPWPETES